MKTKIAIIIISLLLLLTIKCYATGIQCRNQQNDLVDWWFILKLPKNSVPSTSGYGYIYFDSDNTNGKLYVGRQEHELDNFQQALGYTVNQIYNAASNDTAWIMYNDEPPEEKYTYLENQLTGHTKGIIAFNSSSGFWLVHSIPQFPLSANYKKYIYPDNGTTYGQSALCISFPTTDGFTQINNLGTQLAYSNANIYDSNLPKIFIDYISEVVRAVNHKKIINVPGNNTELFFSIKNTEFQSVVQSSPANKSNPNKDFYQYVANSLLKQNLIVQSWTRTGGKLGPACNMQYSVNDVTSLITPMDLGDYSWNASQDHSKWVVSQLNSDAICVGDLNRVQSQLFRGGGTVCFSNKNVHDAVFKMINSQTTCNNNYSDFSLANYE